LWLWRQVGAIAKKRWSPRREGLQTVILIGGLMLALILVADPYVSLFEFQGHSTRGGSSVLDASGDTEKGTRWDYATQWSFHPKELISFVYPYFYGLENYPTRDLKSAAYWGYMPFTQSTHYLGLLTLLLAILGLTVRKPGQFTTSMAAASVIIIVIGFGKYFPVLFWPLFKFAPFFSKFRIPSMIYVLLPLTVGIVAAGGMDTVISGLKERKHEFINRLRIRTSVIFGAVIVGSLLLLVIGKPVYDGLGFFVKSGDASRFRPEILPQVRQIRHDVFQKGLLLSLFIGSGGLAAIWLGIRRTVSGGAVGLVLVGLTIGDLWVVDREFLHLKNPASMRHQFRATPEVNFLLKDHDLFRIFPLDDFNSNWYAYFGLSSIGGYRPVKLRTYQDLMDAGGLNSLPVLNMLNVKYVITGRNISLPGLERVFEGKQFVYRNMSVLPKAWLVYEVESVSSPRESLRKTIDPDFDPSTEAIVINYTGPPLASGGSGTTRVDHYSENQIVLETSSSEGGLAVLSENYYGPGWKATMDGQPAQIFQTNHILRSVYIPAGEHTITYRYDTSRFRLARMISRMSLTLLIVAIGWIHRRDLVRIASRFAKKA
ncbi:MAG: hypothetical protein ACE5GH_04860, partial [Fidelibacterota bacterium]